MFQNPVHKAWQKQSALKAEAEAHAASALRAAAKLSDVLTDSLNEEVREIYETQKLLETESQLLRRELSEARATLTAWQAKLRVLQEGLKGAGDLEHYAEYLAREAALVARASAEKGLLGGAGRAAAAVASSGAAISGGGGDSGAAGQASSAIVVGDAAVDEQASALLPLSSHLPLSRGASR
ncbi:hypothetical protein MNEG_0223 [Monoraphidium neglectum]|uniref:Uncharacterized protein n=1 Tax=Monoraphidium neglectum TaxID=145388 RepID=A0A0D2LN86_9CHLO|nr:hypothetical protein MNEG_0223 [Monoraphidium neglectum]KIZ07724.1 hypothetical protein MNEG_0223 [Monoraphidium neglectum]|eukprot:XP_013906743.1 hypothetical protein MNEG_0223 [Monoraphidium neglectum]